MPTTVTITPAEKEQEDIFKPGNILRLSFEGCKHDVIVMVVKGRPTDSESFCGIALRYPEGHIWSLHNDWAKEPTMWTLIGTITLQST